MKGEKKQQPKNRKAKCQQQVLAKTNFAFYIWWICLIKIQRSWETDFKHIELFYSLKKKVFKYHKCTSQVKYDLHLKKDVYKRCYKFQTTLIFLLLC